jgi:hypothetical protein
MRSWFRFWGQRQRESTHNNSRVESDEDVPNPEWDLDDIHMSLAPLPEPEEVVQDILDKLVNASPPKRY